ncbi:trehalose transport system permease protein SugA [Spirochaetota bacterium]|nr:trehalose transport system permease protein SugA [Spirochaetota bacterium]
MHPSLPASQGNYSRRSLSLEERRIRSAWLLLLPMLLVLALVAMLPLYQTVFYSFTDVSLDDLTVYEFVAFQNYLDYYEEEWYGLLSDGLWWKAVWNTLVFATISVSLETLLGLMIALFLNTKFKGRGYLRAAILIPWALPTVVSAKMWAWMLNDQFGIINDLFVKIGLISDPIAWTASSGLLTIILVDVWKTTPFMALLILAGLQTLPQDCYQAAKIDGVSPVRVFFKVTLPYIKSAIIVAVIFRMLDALRVFDLIYVLTPNNQNTISMSVFARQYLFDFDRFAYGSAASSFLFIVVCMFTLTMIKLSKFNLN